MITTLAALALTASSFPAQAETPRVLDIEATAESIENGCPNGSFDWQTTSDNQYLNMRFYEFEVRTGAPGPGGGPTAEKRCELIANIQVPAGYTVGIESVTIQANAVASDQNSGGYIESSYNTDNARLPATLVSQSYTGPFNGDFNLNGRLSRDRMIFTTCSQFNTQQRMFLNTVLRADTSGFGESSINNHRTQRAVVEQYRFIWSRCNGPNPQPQTWVGSCRIVLETIWGQDVRDYYGSANGWTQDEAIRLARQYGQSLCERERNNDNLYRCTTDNNRCFATRQ